MIELEDDAHAVLPRNKRSPKGGPIIRRVRGLLGSLLGRTCESTRLGWNQSEQSSCAIANDVLLGRGRSSVAGGNSFHATKIRTKPFAATVFGRFQARINLPSLTKGSVIQPVWIQGFSDELNQPKSLCRVVNKSLCALGRSHRISNIDFLAFRGTHGDGLFIEASRG